VLFYDRQFPSFDDSPEGFEVDWERVAEEVSVVLDVEGKDESVFRESGLLSL